MKIPPSDRATNSLHTSSFIAEFVLWSGVCEDQYFLTAFLDYKICPQNRNAYMRILSYNMRNAGIVSGDRGYHLNPLKPSVI